ncbi:MAG: Protein containing Prepilin-type cleavage/methylation, N-terminal domain [Parcubacteria group bacterium Gr01-1014_49]|nr:MAG: Protein containing Prepilin-type cleavage/methylation, N-terminal domain [Parcubacteria group bacterium Gr01-1014_49]
MRNSYFSFANERREKTLSAGFTLIELMVVLAIIVTITTITLSSQSSFNKSIILANTAYDVALTLRSAEIYGLSGRAVGGTSVAGYGLHFQKAVPGSFMLFADTSPAPNASNCHGLPAGGASAPDAKPGNCTYDTGEKVMDYNLGNGITVSDFCAYSFGAWACAYAQGGGLTELDIVFSRPNPEPFINVNGTRACIALSSPQGGARFVSVGASGEITADASSCP